MSDNDLFYDGEDLSKLVLQCESPTLQLRYFFLSSRITSVGRSLDCDLVVPDMTVSRSHAHITVEDNHVIVRDKGSQNGTFVDDQRIETATLFLGKRVRFGRISYILNKVDENWEDIDFELDTAKLDQSSDHFPEGQTIVDQQLSAAQNRVLTLALEGLGEKQIAVGLNLSRHTVHNHLREIYRILNVHSRAELMARVFKSLE